MFEPLSLSCFQLLKKVVEPSGGGDFEKWPLRHDLEDL